MKNRFMIFSFSVTMRQRLLQALLLGIIFAGFVISNFAQDINLSFDRKVEMIDSVTDARIDKYLEKCFPAYKIRVYYEGDSGSLCCMELALWLADEISDDQWPKPENFVTNVAKRLQLKRPPYLF